MNRRGFLGALAAIAATATLDPERLLWVPGKKLISIPAPSPVEVFRFMELYDRGGELIGVKMYSNTSTRTFHRVYGELYGDRWPRIQLTAIVES